MDIKTIRKDLLDCTTMACSECDDKQCHKDLEVARARDAAIVSLAEWESLKKDLKELQDEFKEHDVVFERINEMVDKCIKTIENNDREGSWLEDNIVVARCSVCGCRIYGADIWEVQEAFKYCPDCNSIMKS